MVEEILRELVDLGHILFQIFFVQVLLHDPEVGLYPVPQNDMQQGCSVDRWYVRIMHCVPR